MESVLHPSTLHFFTEIYPNKTIQSFFGHQAVDSTQPQCERKQQRRRSAPAPSPIDNSSVPQQRYQRWSWTASSSVLPMETIQEEQED
ncbi:hypothetical protein [Absidia glauca]|uniref:Uncharacterized protein n=1 Tax=Absidia glauca TaxID=4829 RepID=A0A163JB54_ABSGL|nr:hypothetical protein [Absidia glauca]